MTGLLAWLRGIRLPTVLVLHANHPNEIDDEVRAACAKLRAAGATLLNQSVLLRGVNDDVDTLARAVARAHGCRVSCLTTCTCPIACAAPRISRSTETEAQRLVER